MITIQAKTPYYHYDIDILRQTLHSLLSNAGNYHIHYALKANSNPHILKYISSFGIGADCVSGNEIKQALECGFNPEQIVFAGVGKTDEEIHFAIQNNIACIHCESIHELEVINSIASGLNKKTAVALRINPDIDAQTHKHISTGTLENKFGIPAEEFPELFSRMKEFQYIEFIGLHFHIGSQITNMNVFEKLAKTASEYVTLFNEAYFKIHYLNLGGGLGIDYINPERNPIPDFQNYFDTIRRNLVIPENVSVHFEPGRSVVGQCGTLYSSVLYTKKSGSRHFAILDAGMNDLLRPALYDAKHFISCPKESNNYQIYDVVGPICETSDTFGKQISLPELFRGDILQIKSTGAYGEVMASSYNLRSKAGIVFSHNEFNNDENHIEQLQAV